MLSMHTMFSTDSKFHPVSNSTKLHPLTLAIHSWSSLIAGLLDWITGLTFELKLCVSHDLHPIRCAVNGSHVRCLAANRLLRNKGHGMQ